MDADLKVFYEDNHLIVVFKPSGTLAQPAISSRDGEGDKSIVGLVKRYLKEKYKKEGNVFLGIVHRLDRQVSGLTLFAKTSKGASRISEQIRNKEFIKTYQAIVEGDINPPSGILKDYLLKDEKEKKAAVSKEGDEAILEYRKIKSNSRYSLIEINLITGRFHQIRAQFANLGFPVLGDVKYGAKSSLPDRSIALCATGLEFKTATTEEEKRISIEYPSNWEEYLG